MKPQWVGSRPVPWFSPGVLGMAAVAPPCPLPGTSPQGWHDEGPQDCTDSLSCPSLDPAVDEQNKQTQAYQCSVGPSKDSSEELIKEEEKQEKLSKMPARHMAFCGGMGVRCGMGSK